MIYIAVLCNPKITAELLYNTPLVHWTLCRCQQYGAFSMKALARYQIILLVNRGTLGVNNLPRVVARIMPRSESNPRPLDHESNALPLHHRACNELLSLYAVIAIWDLAAVVVICGSIVPEKLGCNSKNLRVCVCVCVFCVVVDQFQWAAVVSSTSDGGFWVFRLPW